MWFQCYSCNNPGIRFLAIVVPKSHCDLLFSSVAKDSAWEPDVRIWSHLTKSSQQSPRRYGLDHLRSANVCVCVTKGASVFSLCSIIISFTFCDWCTLVQAVHVCVESELVEMTNLWHWARAADIKRLPQLFYPHMAQPSSAEAALQGTSSRSTYSKGLLWAMQWFPTHQLTIRKGSGTIFFSSFFSISSWRSLSIAFSEKSWKSRPVSSDSKTPLTPVTFSSSPRVSQHMWPICGG